MAKYAGKDVTFKLGANPISASVAFDLADDPTAANPTVINSTYATELTDGDIVFVQGFIDEGWTTLNHRFFVVTVIDESSFSIPVNSTGFVTYTAGGSFFLCETLTEHGITNVDLDSQMEEIDITDTTCTAREYLVSNIDKNINFSKFYDTDETTPLEVGDQRYFVLEAGTEVDGTDEYNCYWIGMVVITSRKINFTLNDVTKYDYSGRIISELEQHKVLIVS